MPKSCRLVTSKMVIYCRRTGRFYEDVHFLQHDTVQFRCQTSEILVKGVNLPQGKVIIKESHCVQQVLLIGTIPMSFRLYL